MGWFFEYWKEFYGVMGGLILLILLIACWMDYRDRRKRKDWWK